MTLSRFSDYSILLLLLCGGLLWASCSDRSGPERPAEGRLAALDSLMMRAVASETIPGAVVRVDRGNSILHRQAYGYAQKYRYAGMPIEDPPAMAPGHLFDLASLTKVCATTFGVMLQVDQGAVALDDPIHRWFPEFSEGEKRRVTVRHLLTHTAGLAQWVPTYYHASDRDAQYRYIASLPLAFPVGEARHYSDLGFMLLGELLDRVTGRPLDRYLQTGLFDPLGLQNTLFNPLDRGYRPGEIAATSHGNPLERQMVYDDAFGYRVEEDPESWDGWRRYTLRGEVNDGNAWYGAEGVAGHAGLFSTADDLQALLALLRNGGHYRGRQLLSQAVIDTFLTRDRHGNGLGWAMDPAVFSAEGVPPGSYGHTGFTGTSVAVIPEYNLSIVLLTNRQNLGRNAEGYYPDLGPLRRQVVNTVLDRLPSQ